MKNFSRSLTRSRSSQPFVVLSADITDPLVRPDVDLGADVSLPAPGSSGISVVISPDGTRLVYASGTPLPHIRPLGPVAVNIEARGSGGVPARAVRLGAVEGG